MSDGIVNQRADRVDVAGSRFRIHREMFRNVAITVNLMDIGEVVRLETEVWQALVDGDAEADARLLADDSVGLYPTGIADRATM